MLATLLAILLASALSFAVGYARGVKWRSDLAERLREDPAGATLWRKP